MAVPAGTFQRHTAIGAREDLADIIHDISPVDTPFQNSIGRGRSTSVLTEWQTDALAAAADNAHIEGDDSAANTATPTTRFGNYQQILKKTVSVSGTLRASNTAGRKDELACSSLH